MPPRRGAASAALLLITAATAAVAGVPSAAAQDCPTGPRLVCTLVPTAGNRVGGNVTMTPTTTADGNCTTALTAIVTGLEAGSVHGWHVHEFGDVSSPTGSGTGGHFNPAGVPHALPSSGKVRHVGDLGNLLPVGPDGTAVTPPGATSDILTTAAVVGRGVIIHAKRDDGGQPTGNAGARLAQCVLGLGRPVATPKPPPATTVASPTPSPTTEPTPELAEGPTEEDDEEPVEEEIADAVEPLPVVILSPDNEVADDEVVVPPAPGTVALVMDARPYENDS